MGKLIKKYKDIKKSEEIKKENDKKSLEKVKNLNALRWKTFTNNFKIKLYKILKEEFKNIIKTENYWKIGKTKLIFNETTSPVYTTEYDGDGNSYEGEFAYTENILVIKTDNQYQPFVKSIIEDFECTPNETPNEVAEKLIEYMVKHNLI